MIVMSRKFALAMTIITILGIINTTAATNIQHLGQFGWGPVKAVETQGSILFVGSGATIWIYNTSNINNLTKINEISLGWRVLGLEVNGTYLYVANEKRMVIIDISNLSDPNIIGTVQQESSIYNAYDVKVDGDYAYVAAAGYGLQVVDISNKANPKEIARVKIYGKRMELHGNYIYLLSFDYKDLHIIDISNPLNPIVVGNFTMPNGRPFGIKVVNNIAYVTEYPWGIWAIDVSDPSNPVPLGNWTGSYYGEYESSGIDIKGSYAFVSTWYRGLLVYNISDPSNITLLKELPSTGFKGYMGEVSISGNLAFVAGHYAGVGIYNISNPLNGYLLDVIPTVGRAFGLKVKDNFLLIGGDSGLLIVNVSNPSKPKLENVLKIGRTWGLIIDKNRNLAVTHSIWSGPVILDINDPTKPIELSRYTPNTGPIGIKNNILYIINHITKELEIVNVSDPKHPQKISQIYIGAVWRGAIYGNYAFVTSANKGVTIVDITDPVNPTIITKILENRSGFIPVPAFKDNYMFVAVGGRFVVIDISNIYDPKIVFESDRASIYSVQTYGKYLLVGSKDSIKIFDVTHPEIPSMIGDFKIAHGDIVGIEVDNQYIYTANDYWGSEIFIHNLEPDSTPPFISKIGVIPVNAISVTITWQTNEFADSLVKYGTQSGNYIYQVYDSTFTTTHSITLTNLQPNTTYYFVANSTDASGNSAESAEYSFTTLPGTIKPTTTYSITPTPNQQGWINQNATITFFRSDDVEVAYTNYSFDQNGPWTKVEGDEPFNITIDQEGETTIWFYSVDVNGNVEDMKNLTVKINYSGIFGEITSTEIEINPMGFGKIGVSDEYYYISSSGLRSVAEGENADDIIPFVVLNGTQTIQISLGQNKLLPYNTLIYLDDDTTPNANDANQVVVRGNSNNRAEIVGNTNITADKLYVFLKTGELGDFSVDIVVTI